MFFKGFLRQLSRYIIIFFRFKNWLRADYQTNDMVFAFTSCQTTKDVQTKMKGLVAKEDRAVAKEIGICSPLELLALNNFERLHRINHVSICRSPPPSLRTFLCIYICFAKRKKRPRASRFSFKLF